MPQQMPWPHLYEVTIHDLHKNVYTYKVLSWLNDRKAVAIAAGRHRDVHHEAESRLYNVEVVDLGPVERGADGMPAEPSDCLADRMEF